MHDEDSPPVGTEQETVEMLTEFFAAFLRLQPKVHPDRVLEVLEAIETGDHEIDRKVRVNAGALVDEATAKSRTRRQRRDDRSLNHS